MNLIIRIALRNLLRQKSRTILLGIGIGFGMMILVVSHSFSKGLSDIILNRVIVDIMGHLSVASREKIGRLRSMVIRDRHEMEDLIRKTLPDVRAVRELVMTNMIKAIGNKASVFTIIMGTPDDYDSSSLLETFDVLSGNLDDFTNKKVDNPLILFSSMAEQLNVKVGDNVKLLMGTIYGQIQSARLQLIAIVESQNPFMDQACMIPLEDAKRLMGYQPHETQVMTVVLDNIKEPEITLGLANDLQKALTPKPIVIYGTFQYEEHPAEGSLLGLDTDGDAIDRFSQQIDVLQGDLAALKDQEDAIVIGKSLAEKIQAKIGESISFTYDTRYEDKPYTTKHHVAAIISGNNGRFDNAAFLSDVGLYKFCFLHLPIKIDAFPNAFQPDKDSPAYSLMAMDHYLFPRAENFRDFEKKMREIQKTKFKGQMVDIVAMQEAADLALKMEAMLNLISVITVLILFFILLIGIVNTLRMTIKERTREIGTIRAIGMQKSQVYLSFMMETVFLSLFASIAGIVAGFGLMQLISQMSFRPENVFRIFMDHGHIHFVADAKIIILDLLLIILITMITAYFPSKRAANLVVADALGHHE